MTFESFYCALGRAPPTQRHRYRGGPKGRCILKFLTGWRGVACSTAWFPKTSWCHVSKGACLGPSFRDVFCFCSCFAWENVLDNCFRNFWGDIWAQMMHRWVVYNWRFYCLFVVRRCLNLIIRYVLFWYCILVYWLFLSCCIKCPVRLRNDVFSMEFWPTGFADTTKMNILSHVSHGSTIWKEIHLSNEQKPWLVGLYRGWQTIIRIPTNHPV